MKRMLMAAALALFAAQGVQAQAADGLPGATVRSDSKGSAESKARREQWCKDNPEKCREMQAKMKERREQCKADPEKCRAEKKAHREQWCKDNPEKCREMKAKMEERRKLCEADPSKCPPRKGPGRT